MSGTCSKTNRSLPKQCSASFPTIGRPDKKRSEPMTVAPKPPIGRRKGEAAGAAAVAKHAKAELESITGLDADHVSSVVHEPDGWHVTVDLVELRRIPAATDVIASYEAVLGPTGKLLSYRRTPALFPRPNGRRVMTARQLPIRDPVSDRSVRAARGQGRGADQGDQRGEDGRRRRRRMRACSSTRSNVLLRLRELRSSQPNCGSVPKLLRASPEDRNADRQDRSPGAAH